MVARNHVGDFVEQNLDWAYLRWRPQDDLDIRLGRLGLDVYFLSEYRSVGYAYPWIRPPHEFYANSPIYHFDGTDIARRFALGGGFLTAKAFAGYAFYQLPIYQSGVLDGAAALFGGNLTYEVGNWRWRIAQMSAYEAKELPLKPLVSALQNSDVNASWPGASALAPKLKVMGESVQFTSIGLAYENGDWLVQAEGSYTNSNLDVTPSVATGYLSVGRRLGPVTLYSIYGIGQTLHHHIRVPALRISTPELTALRDGVNTAFNGNGMDEQSASVGVRWDVYRNIAIKAEWNHFWLGQDGVVTWDEPGTGPIPNQVNVWSVGVDFVF